MVCSYPLWLLGRKVDVRGSTSYYFLPGSGQGNTRLKDFLLGPGSSGDLAGNCYGCEAERGAGRL